MQWTTKINHITHVHITTNPFVYLFVFVSFFLMLYHNKTLLDLIVLYFTTFVPFLFYASKFWKESHDVWVIALYMVRVNPFWILLFIFICTLLEENFTLLLYIWCTYTSFERMFFLQNHYNNAACYYKNYSPISITNCEVDFWIKSHCSLCSYSGV